MADPKPPPIREVVSYHLGLFLHFPKLLKETPVRVLAGLTLIAAALLALRYKTTSEAFGAAAAGDPRYIALAIIPIVIFIAYGLLRANYETHQEAANQLKDATNSILALEAKLEERGLALEILNLRHAPSLDGKAVGVFVTATVKNTGPRSIARYYVLNVAFPDGNVLQSSPRFVDPEGGIALGFGDQEMRLYGEDMLYDKTATPIEHGDMKTGHLQFVFPDISHEAFHVTGIHFVLSCEDIMGHPIIDAWTPDVLVTDPMVEHYPGTRPPDIRRSRIDTSSAPLEEG